MSNTHLRLLPNGHLIWENRVETGAVPAKVVAAFKRGVEEGLLALGTEGMGVEGFGEDLGYWRDFSSNYLTRLCSSPPTAGGEDWEPVPLPPDVELRQMVAAAPPAPGMEYLSADVLRGLWNKLDEHVARSSGGDEQTLEAWLRKAHPLWRLVGRVTFHLAENKRNEEFPFAFLSTYTHRVSKRSQLQYLPLGKALKEYAGKQDIRTLEALLAPVTKAAESGGLARELLDSRKVFHALAWTPAEAFRFLESVPVFEEAGLIVKVPDWWKGGRPSRAAVGVTVDTPSKTKIGIDALMSFKVGLAVDGEELTSEEWKRIMESEDQLVSIKGKWVEVDREKLGQVLEQWKRAERAAASGSLSFLQGMRMLSGFGIGGGDGLIELEEALQGGGDWVSITAGDRLRDLLERLRKPEGETGGAPRGLQANLRPYQQAGLNWLWMLRGLGLGGILADDMGLGKTLQVIALMVKMKAGNENSAGDGNGQCLLVVPASLVGNWRAEVEKFAPQLKVLYAHPSQVDRETLQDPQAPDGVDAVVTTYSMLGRLDYLLERPWGTVVLDEAQAIKNPKTAQSKKVKALVAANRFALTGTPIENSAVDLWSLFDFLNPGLLGRAADFGKAVKSWAKDGGKGYANLRKLVSPYILRRLKTDKSVISDLPDKTELRAECPLTKGQAVLYQKSVKELAKQIKRSDLEPLERAGLVLTFLMRFKQICNHPALWTGSGNFGESDSGKFRRLKELCSEIGSRGEKVLVFTQFKEMTGPLADFLSDVFGRVGLVLHGGTPVKRRQKLVAEFQADGGPPFFVISLKAGGTGLNLTAASHVVHFDRWWNPAVEDQATDRAFRIGQKNNVMVHKFVCAGTIEERIDKMISEKREVADAVLSKGAEKALTDMGDEELLEFVGLDLNRAVY